MRFGLSLLIGLAFAANLYVMGFHRRAEPAGLDLAQARAGFQTRSNGVSFPKEGAAPEPPPEVYQFVRYPTAIGEMGAYVTPDPGDGKKRPAIVWGHGGFGGIRDFTWERDNGHSPKHFLHPDFVLMCPSWRGENDNPGQFEMFLGEIDDLLAAIRYVKQLPYVDANRVYAVGFSASGTLTLLAGQLTNDIRAVFSVGGDIDLARALADGKGDGDTPFDPADPKEVYVRNPIAFIDSVKVPTYYLEGGDSWFASDACRMHRVAARKGKPFYATIVPGAHHWSVMQPACELIAQKIRADTAQACNIRFGVDEAMAIYRKAELSGELEGYEKGGK